MPDLTYFKRVIRFSWINFKRGRESSWVIVLVIAVVIFLVSALFLLNGLSENLINQVREKVSIAAYFQRNTDLADMTMVRDDLWSNFPDEISDIKIVSAEEALSHFMDRHRGDPVYQKALDQVGDNPFLPSLDIAARDPAIYGNITEYLIDNYGILINRVDYLHREGTIEMVFNTTNQIRFFGIAIALILAFLVVLIAFSTIRVSVQASRWEIETMKLVGAPNWFARTPFIIQGTISGMIAALIVMVVLFPGVYFLSPQIEMIVHGFNLWNHFLENALWLAGAQVLLGMFLGSLSTLLASHRYLKV